MANDQIPQTILCFKYCLRPTAAQHKRLSKICEEQRILYNAALQERVDAWQKAKKSISYMSQCKSVTELRKEVEFSNVPANMQRATLQRIDRAFKGFFSRVKRGATAGFPRYKGKSRWNSFGFAEFSGIRFDGKRLRFNGLTGGLRVHMHRPMPTDAKLLGCTFKKDNKGWTVSFQVRTEAQSLPETGNIIGIDMGINTLAMLSTGEAIPNVRTTKRHERNLRLRQRALARCKMGSKRRAKVRKKLTRLHAKIANTRQTYLHQVSAKLVRENGIIAIENLSVQGLASGMLAKSVNDASWGKLREYLTYKAANADRKLIAVDPRHTSQDCSGCGTRVIKSLAVRTHHCPACGLVLDRDENAARNILARAVVASWVGERSPVGQAFNQKYHSEGISK